MTVDQNQIDSIVQGITGIINAIDDFSEPLNECVDIIMSEIQNNFDQQGYWYSDDFDSGWAPLAESTVIDRENLGYDGERPILERSGELRESFDIFDIGKDFIVVGNNAFYAIYHQTGTEKMPQRMIIGTTDNSRRAIGLIFGNFIKDELNSQFNSGVINTALSFL